MSTFIAAFVEFLNPLTILLTLVGCLVGMVLGAIPGLAGGTAITVLLPLTYAMNTNMAMAMLMGIYIGGDSGGYIGSILLGIPGTSANVATVYDGYEMTKKGQVTKALSIATVSNFMGTLPSLLVAMLACPVIAALAVKMGPWEYFALAFMAITLVVSLSKGKMLKGFIGAALGLFITQIGYSPISSTPRFTFDSFYLAGGFNTLTVLIGLFAGSMIMIDYATKNGSNKNNFNQKIEKFYFPGKEILENKFNILRSFLIGLFIGFLPGMGPALSNVVSYSTAKSSSKHPEKFGTGCEEGVFAPEVANNASIGGAIIPMVSLGIPGDGTTVLLLSALSIHGIYAGPLLQKNNPTLVSMIFVAGIISAIFALIIQIIGIRYLPAVLNVPYPVLVKIKVVKAAAAFRRVLFGLQNLKVVERAAARCGNKQHDKQNTHAAAFFFFRRLLGFFRLRLGFFAAASGHVVLADRAAHIYLSGFAFIGATANGGRGCFGASVLHKC